MAAITPARILFRTDESTAPKALPAPNLWAIALTVTMATFMELLDTSISNVSLPHIAGGLGTSYDESTWILTSYLVANAIILPMSAWLSRVFGRKRFYMMSVALFTTTSLLCGIAPSLSMLIVFRVLQGLGGGGLGPVEQAILVDTFPVEKRAAAFALYSMAIVTAPAVGPFAPLMTNPPDKNSMPMPGVPVALTRPWLMTVQKVPAGPKIAMPGFTATAPPAGSDVGVPPVPAPDRENSASPGAPKATLAGALPLLTR